MINLYGNGLIGRVDVHYDSTWVEDDEEGGYYSVSRRDERFFYFKDHLGSIRMTLDENSDIVSAQDYYPYGEILRSYTLLTLSYIDWVQKHPEEAQKHIAWWVNYMKKVSKQ